MQLLPASRTGAWCLLLLCQTGGWLLLVHWRTLLVLLWSQELLALLHQQ